MILALPLAIAFLAAPALAVLDGRRPRVAQMALVAMAATFVATALLAGLVLGGEERRMVAGDWAPGVGIVLRADALGVVFALLTNGVLLAALAHQVAEGVRSRTFPALVLFLAAGLTGLFLTADVFNFYVWFELSMIAAYVLSSYGGQAGQLGASFIFAVVNLLGSFVFLLGVAGVYHVTGTLEMETVAARIVEVDPTATILIALAFFVAFGIKLGLFPFHFWLPAIYTSARPSVAAILSGALANIGSYGLLRFGGELMRAELELGATVLLVIGTTSIVYGALQAVSRRNASEVLAYSAIGQAGYVLIALAVGGPVGFGAAVLYAAVNSLNKALLFLSTELRGWLIGAAFALGALSVAGVPPSAGFFGKVAVFQAGIDADSVAVVALVFAGGALSVLYMFQIYQNDFWRGNREARPDRLAVRAATIALAAVILVLGLWPEPLLAASQEAAEVLLGGGA